MPTEGAVGGARRGTHGSGEGIERSTWRIDQATVLGRPTVNHMALGSSGPVHRYGYHPAMATWIIAGGCVALAAILGGAVLLVVLATRGESDDATGFPRLRRFGSDESEDAPVPPDDG